MSAPVSAGSIGDDAEFARLMESFANAWVLDDDAGNAFKSAKSNLITYIDSRPRQAAQKAPAKRQNLVEKNHVGAGLRWAETIAAEQIAIAHQSPAAVRDAALDDAAKACIDEQVDYASTSSAEDQAYNSATVHCSDAIRALKSSAPKLADGEVG